MSTVSTKTLQLGSNADQSKNFKITVPTPEDGTLTIERANGTDVAKVETDGKVSFSFGIFGFSITSTNTGGGSQSCLSFPSWLGGLKIQWGNQVVTSNTDILFAVPFTTIINVVNISVTPAVATSYIEVAAAQVSGQLDRFQGFVSRQALAGGAWSAGSSQCGWIAIGY